MKKIKEQKGITLIALIITIIILLILAVVTIAAVNGDGIISKAKQAKTDYENAQATENSLLGNYLAEMENLIGNNTLMGENNTTVEDSNQPEEEPKSNIASYTEEGVPIPVGFRYVEGTKDTGLVIENEADGSQFVWIPVTEPISEYGLGTKNNREPDVITQELDTNSNSYKDGADKNKENLDILNGILGTSYTNSDEFLAVLQEDFNLMADSVNTNGGFYVGRYETSLNGNIAQSVKGVTSLNAETANTWYGLYAYQKAYSTDSVQGSMIWGSQYDRMMTWMQNTGTDVESNIPGYNQSRITGSDDYPDDVINNVYDLYGNSYEWTLEAVYTYCRMTRGGSYNNYLNPKYRYYNKPMIKNTSYGSRLSIYIK